MKETTRTRKNRPSALAAAGRAAFAALAAAVMMGAASCKKESSEGAAPATGGYFTAVTQPHTGDGKTSLTGNEVKWTGGEMVKIFNGVKGSADFVATLVPDDLTKADLATGGDFAYAGPYLAVYPAGGTSFNADNNTLSGFHMAATQDYVEGGFANNTNPMAAYATGPNGETNTVNLAFQNLCGLLRFKLTGHDESIGKIVIKAANGEHLNGSGNVTVSNDNIPALGTLNGTDEITLNCNGVELVPDNAKTFCVLLPPVTLGKGFSMEVWNASGYPLCTKYVTGNTPIVASTAYDIKIGSQEVLDVPPQDLSIHKRADGTTWPETANCYIVSSSEEKYYRFPCNVRGNKRPSSCVALSGSAYNEVGIAGVNSCEVLWETTNSSEAPAAGAIVTEVSMKDNYIWFKATGTKGNALIAVKDASGTILWSWHIWCTGGKEIGTAPGNGCTLMDRNLGALSDGKSDDDRALSAGFMYQWGRKDPLFGSADYTTGVSLWKGVNSNGVEVTTGESMDVDASEAVNLKYSIESPHKFIKNANDPWDWFTKKTDATADNYPSNGLWAESKTMYDPCPAGWRVAQNGAFGTGSGLTPGADGSGWAYCEGDGNGSFDSKKGLMFNGSYFPASGYRNLGSGELSNVGSYGYSWSCSPYSTTPRDAYYLYFYSSKVYPESDNRRANGFPVRPVQESSSSSK